MKRIIIIKSEIAIIDKFESQLWSTIILNIKLTSDIAVGLVTVQLWSFCLPGISINHSQSDTQTVRTS